MKRVLILAVSVVLAAACMLAGCGKKTIRIANVDEAKNTFDFIESGSGKKVAYEKLVVDGKEVIDWACTSLAGVDAVMFATEEGQIVREGNRTSFSGMKAYTTAAELLYDLKDGVLTITGTK